ncbi:MAG: hypothetical protein LBI87_15725, partial [Candidatus Accumulibacter sp.]|nr:hypothetical protein [Accumulibacter sp.]
ADVFPGRVWELNRPTPSVAPKTRYAPLNTVCGNAACGLRLAEALWRTLQKCQEFFVKYRNFLGLFFEIAAAHV